MVGRQNDVGSRLRKVAVPPLPGLQPGRAVLYPDRNRPHGAASVDTRGTEGHFGFSVTHWTRLDGLTGLVLPLLRGLHLAALLSLLGGAVFQGWLLPADAASRRVAGVCRASLWAALLSGGVWLCCQGDLSAGNESVGAWIAALPVVALHTRFGLALVVRSALLAVALWPRVPPRGVALLAAMALMTQGVLSHAGSADGWAKVALEAPHLLGAGIWLGMLPALLIEMPALSPAAATTLRARFSRVTTGCALLLAVTGVAQGWGLFGGWVGLVGTEYGHATLLKLVLVAVLLGLAAMVRGKPHLSRLAGAAEIALGLAIVVVAAFMASASPGAHTQPIWPFPWQFSLVTVNEDPDFRQEVVTALILIGVAVLVLVATLVAGRFRLVAAAALVAVCYWWGPSLGLLLVEAYPTSFQTSPTGFAPASIVRGQTLFAANCARCHGADGAGDGPDARQLRIQPADLTAPHIWGHTDGELFWWLTHGYDDPEGGLAMPGFAGALSEDDRWALIDYIRAHNVAVAMRQEASIDIPVTAPAMALRCRGVPALSMAELRGKSVHVVAGDAPRMDVPDVVTVTLDGEPADGACAAADADARAAYAVLSDGPAEALPGTEFLIDPAGLLRFIHRAGTQGWMTRQQLISEVDGICASPIDAANGGEHGHHH